MGGFIHPALGVAAAAMNRERYLAPQNTQLVAEKRVFFSFKSASRLGQREKTIPSPFDYHQHVAQ
jgi:hypothetical protein